MSATDLIDERGLNAAAAFAIESQARGDRFLKEIGVQQIIEAYEKGKPPKMKDSYIDNLLQQAREHLQENSPVMAYQTISKLKEYLQRRGDI